MSRPEAGPATLVLEGGPRERGLAHGRALAGACRRFLDDGLTRLNHVRETLLTLDALHGEIRAYAEILASETPALWTELTAFADGAELTTEETVLLQIRREVMGYTRFDLLEDDEPAAEGDCTAFARIRFGQSMLAQTVDLACEMQEHLRLLCLSGPDLAGGGSAIVSFTGLAGYLGLNAAGLAVGLNLVLAGEWKPGVPPYLAIRHLLDCAETVEDALDLLAETPLASSRNFILCDARRAVMVEAAIGETRLLAGEELTHANHFLHPDFAPLDQVNMFARNSSERRRDAIASWLTARARALEPDEVFDFFCAAPLNVQGPRDMRRERTVAAVVMEPERGRLTLRRGDPAERDAETIELRRPRRSQEYLDQKRTGAI